MPIMSQSIRDLRSYTGLAENGREFSHEEFSGRIKTITGVDFPVETLRSLESGIGNQEVTVVQMDALMNYANETGFCNLPIYEKPWEGNSIGLAGFSDSNPLDWKYLEGIRVNRKHNPRDSLETK